MQAKLKRLQFSKKNINDNMEILISHFKPDNINNIVSESAIIDLIEIISGIIKNQLNPVNVVVVFDGIPNK
jgi:hypothetical protein